MCHQQNWPQVPLFMHSLLMMSQVTGFSTKNQCWQTCVSVLLVTFIWSQWSPCLRAENSLSAKLRRKETWQVQHWWKENHRKARGEGSQNGKGKGG